MQSTLPKMNDLELVNHFCQPMKNFYLILLVVIAMQIGCKKESETTTTFVTGKIYNSISGKPVDGKVTLWEYKSNGDLYKSSSYPYKKLDSVRTTANGSFAFILKGYSKNSDIRASVVLGDQFTIDRLSSEKLKIGQTNHVEIQANEWITFKARILYDDLPQIPLTIYSSYQSTSGKNVYYLNRKSLDTTLILKVVPGAHNRISFSFPATVRNKSMYYKEDLFVPMTTDTTTWKFYLDITKFQLVI